jgi:hypothetical protein
MLCFEPGLDQVSCMGARPGLDQVSCLGVSWVLHVLSGFCMCVLHGMCACCMACVLHGNISSRHIYASMCVSKAPSEKVMDLDPEP